MKVADILSAVSNDPAILKILMYVGSYMGLLQENAEEELICYAVQWSGTTRQMRSSAFIFAAGQGKKRQYYGFIDMQRRSLSEVYSKIVTARFEKKVRRDPKLERAMLIDSI